MSISETARALHAQYESANQIVKDAVDAAYTAARAALVEQGMTVSNTDPAETLVAHIYEYVIESAEPDSTQSDDDGGRTRIGNTPPPEEGESTPCDECGADIPDSERSCINSSHSPACSLYPANARD